MNANRERSAFTGTQISQGKYYPTEYTNASSYPVGQSISFNALVPNSSGAPIPDNVILPDNMDWIVSSGCSAGGELSALLGASRNSPLYDPYLKEIGAAEDKDNIFAGGCGPPVTDHARQK